MARTTAPLLSFEGSGQIGKTLVYATWKGRQYTRRYTVGANPNTADQQLTRNTFRFLTNLFKFFPGGAVAAWNLYADSSRFTSRNGFIKLNNGPLREETTLANMTLSPSARGGIIAEGITVTPGSEQLTVDLTAPVLPTGWSITAAYAVAVRNQDPQTEAFYDMTSATVAMAPWTLVLSDLVATEEYLVGGWFQFTRPDGTFAYGRSLQAMATPTA